MDEVMQLFFPTKTDSSAKAQGILLMTMLTFSQIYNLVTHCVELFVK